MLLKPKYQIVIAGLCLAIVAILSLMIGNTLVSPGTVIQALFNFDSENDLHDVVTGARIENHHCAIDRRRTSRLRFVDASTYTKPNSIARAFRCQCRRSIFVIFSITFIQIQSFKMIVVIAFLGLLLLQS